MTVRPEAWAELLDFVVDDFALVEPERFGGADDEVGPGVAGADAVAGARLALGRPALEVATGEWLLNDSSPTRATIVPRVARMTRLMGIGPVQLDARSEGE
jgi:hypothetical protein